MAERLFLKSLLRARAAQERCQRRVPAHAAFVAEQEAAQMSEQLPSVLGMGVGEVTPEPGSLQAVERQVPGVSGALRDPGGA